MIPVPFTKERSNIAATIEAVIANFAEICQLAALSQQTVACSGSVRSVISTIKPIVRYHLPVLASVVGVGRSRD